MTAISLRRERGRASGRLGDGMGISATVRARLLGFRILELDADIAVVPRDEIEVETVLTPAEGSRRLPASEARSAPRAPISHLATTPASRNGGAIGSGLEDVARALDAGAADLAAAREHMP